MYHEATKWGRHSYYDTIEEMPKTAKVKFPNGETKEMTADEICALDEQGLFTIMHSCNYGTCDHWTSEKPSTWVRKRFMQIYEYVEDGKTVGYNRAGWSIDLTTDGHFFKAEVWNS